MDGKPGVFLDLPEVNLAEAAAWKGQRALADESGGWGSSVHLSSICCSTVPESCSLANRRMGELAEGGKEVKRKPMLSG